MVLGFGGGAGAAGRDNNVAGSLTLLAAMARAGVQRIVFGSSATVYGDPPSNPVREDFPLRPANC